jgi:hypothetical protein
MRAKGYDESGSCPRAPVPAAIRCIPASGTPAGSPDCRCTQRIMQEPAEDHLLPLPSIFRMFTNSAVAQFKINGAECDLLGTGSLGSECVTHFVSISP